MAQFQEMANRFPLTEARAKLTEIVSSAQYAGKVTIITRNGKDAAAVIPVSMFVPDGSSEKKPAVSSGHRLSARKEKA